MKSYITSDCGRLLSDLAPRDKFEKAAGYLTLRLSVEREEDGKATLNLSEIAQAILSGQGN
jgi:hypothetical protein